MTGEAGAGMEVPCKISQASACICSSEDGVAGRSQGRRLGERN